MSETKTMVDPFGGDTKESLQKDIKIWNEIFSTCPGLADNIIKLYKEHGIKCMQELVAVAFNPDAGASSITGEEPVFWAVDGKWELRWRHPSDPDYGTIPVSSDIYKKSICSGIVYALNKLGYDIYADEDVSQLIKDELKAGQLDPESIASICRKHGLTLDFSIYSNTDQASIWESMPLAGI